MRRLKIALTALLLSGAALPALAQDAGQILRDVERSIPKAPPPTPATPDLAPPVPEEGFLKEGETVRVTGFRLTGVLIAEAELQAHLADYVGRDCTLGDLREAAARVSRYYAKRDLLARAVLPRQSLDGGVVIIQVLEARMGKVRIDPSSSSRLDPQRAADFIHAQNAPGEPLHPSRVATGVSNLGIIPGTQGLGILDAGETEGTTDVILKLREPPLVSTTAIIDNNSASEIGRVRGLAVATVTDASGFGEQATLVGQATRSSRYGQVSAGAPLFDGGMWLEGTGSILSYDIPKSVNVSEPSGMARQAGLTARWLALRSSAEPVSLSVGIDHKWTHDKVSGLETGRNRLAAISFGAHRIMRDAWLGGGAFVLDAALRAGNVDLSGNRGNKLLDKSTADTSGRYAKLTLSVARRQALWLGGDVMVALSGQVATKNLNSAEQFSLGGMNGTRAYPVNAGSGDQGATLSVELGHQVLDRLRVAGFWDGGLIQQHLDRWTGWEGLGSPHNVYFQQGVGALAQWSPLDAVQVKAIAAKRVGPDAGRGLDLQTANRRRAETRAWVQLALTF